jgi:glucosamine-6-phosphate deaminase
MRKTRRVASPVLPDHLTIPGTALGKGQPVHVRVLVDMRSIAEDLAAAMLAEIQAGEPSGQGRTLIIPVGPVDQYALLTERINAQRVSCRQTVFINMDEYLTDADEWIPTNHPLSFRGFMERSFYSLIDSALAPPEQNRVFPDPQKPDDIPALIAARGGVDACFGGIGINGHLAFNEPPEPGESVSLEEFAALPTRILSLSRETRTINSVTVGGEINVIPKRAITVGMKEILGSRRLRFYCNRSWQSAVIRRALHGPLTSACPASFLRLHPDAVVTIADFVASPPEVQLR